MSVTRDVVTDLLPVYFSGEASEDTRRLVEEYFRGNPEFERIARSAATPLETLRVSAPVGREAETEKQHMERVGWELRSRRVWLVLAVLYTILPFLSLVSGEFAGWLGAPHTPGGRVGDWVVAAFFWTLYFIRIRRRDLPLAMAIAVTLVELMAVLSRLNPVTNFTGRANNFELILIGALAALCWIWHFRWRERAKGLSRVSGGFGFRKRKKKERSWS